MHRIVIKITNCFSKANKARLGNKAKQEFTNRKWLFRFADSKRSIAPLFKSNKKRAFRLFTGASATDLRASGQNFARLRKILAKRSCVNSGPGKAGGCLREQIVRIGRCIRCKKKSLSALYRCIGNVLSFRTVSSQVFSAMRSLTSVFGMGTGGSFSPWSPTLV